jgi:hypothetical protein
MFKWSFSLLLIIASVAFSMELWRHIVKKVCIVVPPSLPDEVSNIAKVFARYLNATTITTSIREIECE